MIYAYVAMDHIVVDLKFSICVCVCENYCQLETTYANIGNAVNLQMLISYATYHSSVISMYIVNHFSGFFVPEEDIRPVTTADHKFTVRTKKIHTFH